MSHEATAIVRAARLPRTLRQRPELKLVLLALANRADKTGANAWPSVSTIAAECEMSPRTVQALLRRLANAGFIAETAPARQHRPTTWHLSLDRLSDSATQTVAPLEPSHSGAGVQHAAPLTPALESPGVQIESPGVQNSASGAQASAPYPCTRTFEPKERSLREPTHTREKKSNLTHIAAIARKEMGSNLDADDGEQREMLKRLAAKLEIPYNGASVATGIEMAKAQRTKGVA